MNEKGSQHYTAESYFKKESAQFAARWWWGLGSVNGGDGGGGDGGRGGGVIVVVSRGFSSRTYEGSLVGVFGSKTSTEKQKFTLQYLSHVFVRRFVAPGEVPCSR
jgi:hypothetical protein